MFTDKLKEAFWRIPIKQKLILLMMAVAVVSVILTTLSSTLSGVIYIKQNEENELAVLAEIVGDKNAAALVFQNQTLVKASLGILASKPSVRKACIYDADGNIFARYKEASPCPEVIADTILTHGGQIELFHTISKKGDGLGTVYLQSDLRAVDRYLQKQWAISAGIIFIICLVSYLITLKLQHVISNPIRILAEEMKSIFKDDYSARTRKIYYDELGEIADSFNKILEERERKHKAFFDKAEAFDYISKSSEKTLATLDDEAVFPFKAASTFKALLEKQVFGPVSPMYYDYFNDVYAAEVQLYYVLAKAFDSFRLQSELLLSERESVDIGSLMDKVVKEVFDKEGDLRFSYATFINTQKEYSGYQKPLKRLLENIATLFTEVKTLGRLYECQFVLDENEGRFTILAKLSEQNNYASTCNDNYLVIPLQNLIHKLKNNEEVPVIHGKYFINMDDVMVRSRLYSIHFLSNIKHAEIEVRLSSHDIVLAITLGITLGEGAAENMKPLLFEEASL